MSMSPIMDFCPISSPSVCLSATGIHGKNMAMVFCSCCPPKLGVPGAISWTWVHLVSVAEGTLSWFQSPAWDATELCLCSLETLQPPCQEVHRLDSQIMSPCGESRGVGRPSEALQPQSSCLMPGRRQGASRKTSRSSSGQAQPHRASGL